MPPMLVRINQERLLITIFFIRSGQAQPKAAAPDRCHLPILFYIPWLGRPD